MDNLRNVSTEDRLDIVRSETPEIEKLLNVYPKEAADKIIKNKDKIAAVCKSFNQVSPTTSVNTMVMTCNLECPYSNICVLRKNSLDPVGHPCPIEKKIASELECEVTKTLDIDVSNPIEMELLWDLIDTKLLDMRASSALRDGSLVVLVESKVGQVVTQRTELSPLLEIKVDLKRLKHSIIDQFVATRRAKKKYGMESGKNALEQMLKDAAQKVND